MAFAPVGDLDVYHEVHGDGPPFVLVMGLGVDHRAWIPLLPLFDGFTTVIFDNAGTGRTRRRADGLPPPPPYSTARLGDDLAGLLGHLDLGPAHVVGVSMGGAVAMQLAIRHPRTVRTLALVSTWHRADGWLREIFAFRRPLLEQLGPEALLRFVALWAWGSSSWQPGGIAVSSTERIVAQAAGAWDDGERERYLGHLDASIAHDCEELLAGIAAPTLVVVGDEDVLTAPRFARAIADRIPGARLEVVPGRGHAFAFEDPERFAAIVTAFAREHQGP